MFSKTCNPFAGPVRLAIVLGLAMLVPGGPARAGAWTLAEDDGQLFITTGRKVAPAGALLGGIAERDTTTMQVFVEYGLTDRLTLGLVGRAEMLTTTLQLDLEIGGHARYRLWQGPTGDVISIQAGGRFPLEETVGPLLAGGTEFHVAEAGAGLLYGRGWQWGWGDSFVTTELGFRWRGAGVADELRLEATAGHKPVRQLMALFSVYSALPVGPGVGDASLKLAPSVAYTFWPWLGRNDKKPDGPVNPSTLQIGVSYDILNPDHGLAIDFSVWKRF